MTQIQKQHATTTQTEPEKPVEPVNLAKPELTEEVDAMLDEIDGVLEENAAEFVRNYVQHGGQ